jgi:hypothetical protein
MLAVGGYMNLKDLYTQEEQERLIDLLREQRGTIKLLTRVIDRLVKDRADALIREPDHSKLSIRKSEYDGANKLATELSSFIEKAGREQS